MACITQRMPCIPKACTRKLLVFIIQRGDGFSQLNCSIRFSGSMTIKMLLLLRFVFKLATGKREQVLGTSIPATRNNGTASILVLCQRTCTCRGTWRYCMVWAQDTD